MNKRGVAEQLSEMYRLLGKELKISRDVKSEGKSYWSLGEVLTGDSTKVFHIAIEKDTKMPATVQFVIEDKE